MAFENDARALKETIANAIGKFEQRYPDLAVKMGYTADNGLNLDIKPKQTMSYSVKAGNTVPLAAKKAPAETGK